MAEAKTYAGGCHCGAVRYEVATDLTPLISCNCSICTKHGLLLTFVSEPAFKLLSGKDDVKEYLFNKKHIHHQFCPTCGVESFARGAKTDGTPMVAINVRCLEGVDIASLSPTPFNGRDL
ncbi:MAG TPA: GFA family protein [Vineibacter sp.]|nr:GFA family protein [Vineibacter sp.]